MTDTSSTQTQNAISRLLTSRRERRAHDRAMLDPRIASEHAVQVASAVSRGESGCSICS